MKKLTILVAIAFVVCSQAGSASAQKRPVKKPVTTATPKAPAVKPTPKTASPAEEFFNQGLKCEAKDYDCQVSNYTKAINLNLATNSVFQKRAAAYRGREEYEKAIGDLTKAIELAPNDPNGFKERGRSYLLVRPVDYQKAIADFSSALDLEPKDAEALRLRGNVYAATRMTDRAGQDFEKAIAITPNDVEAMKSLANFYASASKSDKAAELITKALELRPGDPDLYLSRAKSYQSSGQTDLALADFSKAITTRPDSADLYQGRATVYLGIGKTDLALADIQKVIQIDPRRMGLKSEVANDLERKGKFREALQIYKDLLIAFPDDVAFLIKRGYMNMALGDYGAAAADLNKAISLNPRSSKAYETRCAMNVSLSNDNGVMEDCSKAIQLDPDVEEPYMYRAMTTYKSTQNLAELTAGSNKANENKVTNANRVLSTNPKDYDALFKRGYGQYGLKNYAAADADFEKAIKLQPDWAAPYQFLVLSKMQQAVAANPANWQTVTGNFAVELYSNALKVNPNSVMLLSARASAYSSHLKDHARAIQEYTRVIELEPKNADLHTGLANAYMASKDYVKADQECTKAGEVDLKKGVTCYLLANVPFEDMSTVKGQEFNTKANAYIQTAIDNFPDDFWYWKYMGMMKSKGHYFDPKYSEARKKRDYVKEGEINMSAQQTAVAYYLKCNQVKPGACSGDIENQRKMIEIVQKGISAQKAIKSQMRAATWGAILESATVFLETLNAGKNKPVATVAAPTQQTTTPSTANPSSVTGSSGEAPGPSCSASNGIVFGGSGADCNQYLRPGSEFDVDSVTPGTWQNCSSPDENGIKNCWGAWQESGLNQISFRLLGPNRNKVRNTYTWTVGFKNTSNTPVKFSPEITYGDGTSQPGSDYGLAPGSEMVWHVTSETNSNSRTASIRIRRYAYCTNASRTAAGWKCN